MRGEGGTDRQPLKGLSPLRAQGAPAIEGATPLTKIGFANTSIPSLRFQHKTNLPRERFVYTSGVRPGKPQFPRFGTILLDTGQAQGAPARHKARQPLKGCALTKIGFANTSIPSLRFQHKTNLPHERFVHASGVRSKKPQLPDLAQCFWMRGEYKKAFKGAWRI